MKKTLPVDQEPHHLRLSKLIASYGPSKKASKIALAAWIKRAENEGATSEAIEPIARAAELLIELRRFRELL